MATLLCVRGPLTGLRIPLAGEEITIGRGGECTVVLPDSTVSRVHARIRKHRMGWLLDDCKSAHGTFLNGREAGESFPLAANDEIRIGHTILLFDSTYGVQNAGYTDGTVYTTRPPSGQEADPVAVLDAVPEEEHSAAARDATALLAGLLDGPAVPLGEAAARTVGRIAVFFRADVAALLLEDPANGELRAAALAGSANKALLDRQALSRAYRQRQAMLLTGRPVLKKHPVPGAPKVPAERSLLLAPVMAGTACLGLLSIQRDELDAYSTKDLHLVRAVGCLVGVWMDSRRRAEALRRACPPESPPLLFGNSPAVKRLRERLLELAAESAVLLRGERGTDLEAAAREVHRLQSAGNPAVPFLTVRYRGESAPQFEAELFGQQRGAFNSATESREGLLELARGGALYIEEITEIPPGAQEKLLRYLQHGGFARVGEERLHRGAARIVAATARGPEEEARAGRLDKDLLARLERYTAVVPPLRDRQEDIPALAEHWLRRAAARHRLPPPELGEGAAAALAAYAWPGNERELALTMERAVLLSARGEVEPGHLGLADAPTLLQSPPPPPEKLTESEAT